MDVARILFRGGEERQIKIEIFLSGLEDRMV